MISKYFEATEIMEQRKTKNWPSLLPHVMYTMNTSKSSSTKLMPYEVTFNRKPNRGEAKQFKQFRGDHEIDIEVAADVNADFISDSAATVDSASAATVDVDSSDDDIPISSVVTRKESQLKADQIQEQLNRNKVSNGEKMVDKHDHRRNRVTRDFNVGDLVSVKIPRIDRAGTIFKRLEAMVGSITSHQSERQHRLLTEYGTLNDTYRTGDLEPMLGCALRSKVNIDQLNVRMVSMTEAAALQATTIGSLVAVNTLCQCKTGCFQDKRCKCFKAGLKCTSHCHGKLDTGATKSKTKPGKKCNNKEAILPPS
jgi:hypothetical protein